MPPPNPIRPTDLAEGGAVGHVFNRRARRARDSQEKAAARRASREQARAEHQATLHKAKAAIAQPSPLIKVIPADEQALRKRVADLTCAAVARDWEDYLIEHGVRILGDDGAPLGEEPLASTGQPGERRLVGDDTYEWVPDFEDADVAAGMSGRWVRLLQEAEIQRAADIIVSADVVRPTMTVVPMSDAIASERSASDTTIGYRVTPDGKTGAPIGRFGVAGRVIDGKIRLDSVGLSPLEPGDAKPALPYHVSIEGEAVVRPGDVVVDMGPTVQVEPMEFTKTIPLTREPDQDPEPIK
jgi:hypothetical protein